MGLQEFWIIIMAVLFVGFFVLEGFDFGVGMLMPFFGLYLPLLVILVSMILRVVAIEWRGRIDDPAGGHGATSESQRAHGCPRSCGPCCSRCWCRDCRWTPTNRCG
jgi:cytochrome bd-type quinol oxidase subunit 2